MQSQLDDLRSQLVEKDEIIARLRNEADMNAQKILFLSHYATQLRVDGPKTSSSHKRRLSDISEKERKLYRRVSDACHTVLTSKVDTEEKLSEELRTRFDALQKRMEISAQEMSEKYKLEILELKSKLLGINSSNS
jgi:hypothetical protein